MNRDKIDQKYAKKIEQSLLIVDKSIRYSIV